MGEVFWFLSKKPRCCRSRFFSRGDTEHHGPRRGKAGLAVSGQEEGRLNRSWILNPDIDIMSYRMRKPLIIFLGCYVLLWTLTWTAGVNNVKRECERRYGALPSVSAYSPCPFLVGIDFQYDHPLGKGEMAAWYLWAFGYCKELHERPGVHAQKL